MLVATWLKYILIVCSVAIILVCQQYLHENNYISHFHALQILLLLMLLLILVSNYRLIYIVVVTMPRDIRGTYRLLRVLQTMKWAERNHFTIPRFFDRTANKNPEGTCFYFQDEEWKYEKVQRFTNQIANYFKCLGFQKHDTIALFMENSPEFVCMWLGLNKIGIATALINFNLRNSSLIHCLKIAQTKAIIYGTELHDAIDAIREQDDVKAMAIFKYTNASVHKENEGRHAASFGVDLNVELMKAATSIPFEQNIRSVHENLFYIYTSGTTGMPKAAPIKHYRYLMASVGLHFMNQVTEKDVVYVSLPLYHMTGGMVGLGQALLYGTPVVIRKKFSASEFWKDCVKYNVTVAQYLGEICRYLLAQPDSTLDTAHKVRIMVGNGLRQEIWKEFVTRFKVPQIGEVYGSTEGNCNITNIDSKMGSVGFVPRLLYKLLPMALIKVDEMTGEPLRDKNTGLAIRCKPNEPGEIVGKIIKNHLVRDFQGYCHNEEATNKKIIYDVFQKGDAAFRSGDMLVMDEFGYFYFKDRTGDTYRWKGENVASVEVESVVSNACGHKDVAVYGVKVPHTEGKAGMAAIACNTKENVDFIEIQSCLKSSLPSYAIPIFIRLLDSIDITGTFKKKKIILQQEGFNINQITDRIYFYKNGQYVLLDSYIYNDLISGSIKI